MTALVPSLEDIHDYFVDATRAYATYAGPTAGWHIGLWEPGVSGHGEALLASNRRLLAGLAIDAQSHILDAGCGVGGLAIWAARTFGCRVTGITVVPMHVAMAQLMAARAGVSHLCDFQQMDQAAMAFHDATFDVVTNQESWCYVEDKARYFRDVLRVLRPGGAWRAIEGAVAEHALPAIADDLHRTICAGWHMYPEPRRSDVERLLREAGFAPEPTEDLTPLALPHVRPWLAPGTEATHEEWQRQYADAPRLADNLEAHYAAGRACARGLIEGYFHYVRYAAVKPD
jgi:SAM-dependent methyltransferase